jgi:type IV pilus assembly protein PilY1
MKTSVSLGLFLLLGNLLASTHGIAAGGANTPAQTPLFTSESAPPLNMLVMGRDHKLYYEAYNDASDLNADGVLDVGYKGHLSKDQGGFDYYGYYNSNVCYHYESGTFIPQSLATNKTCSGLWSGDYLNYLTTSRMDALRKVLYGGYRSQDTTTKTVLQGAYIPRDAHAWGKEYLSLAHDGYLISSYTPLSQPAAGFRHLFAVVSRSQDSSPPQLRVLTNTSFRIWNWVSIEGPVAENECTNSTGSRVSCTSGGPSNWTLVPEEVLSNVTVTTWKDSKNSPSNKTGMDSLFTDHTSSDLCGSSSATQIFKGVDGNPNTGNGCTDDYYHSLITATLTVPVTGTYKFAVDGDDAVDVSVGGTWLVGWYSGHSHSNTDSSLNSHSGSITLTAGSTVTIQFRHEEATGADRWGLYWILPGTNSVTLTDYNAQVEVCPATESLRESNCKVYGDGIKPTGVLHDFGASDRMLFGLLTGSYAKNMSGGVLRANISSFSREIDRHTGQFCSSDSSYCTNTVNNPSPVRNGIVDTINKLRHYGYNYTNKNYGDCGWITTAAMTEANKCYIWGNPIAEMMYESLRYFSGASTATASYTYSGSVPDQTLGLPSPTWVAPYSTSGSAYPSCSIPAMTVISDINPSFDFTLPGANTNWQTLSNTGDPASISSFSATEQTNAIGVTEGLTGKKVFIGESNGVADNAPTAKTIQDLSTVRGLSPEEPSKQGTYYSAGVARFAANNPIGGTRKLHTYSVALASPLPKFQFPVGDNTITFVPFAKSVGGSSINITSSFQPTDQIVDFYIEKIANTDSQGKDSDSTVNEGRPYAKFRINYEDVEQGADHDMDAIALYTLAVDANGQLTIAMTSEYAAGSIDQHMGYVISGTTKDGVYLEVKDQSGQDIAYKLDTPEGKWAGECASTGASCAALTRLTSTRTFTANSGGSSANLLENPLWYAAKYGMPERDPSSVTGDPDNYFLVTNASTLKEQLSNAFSSLEQANSSVNSPSVAPVQTSTSDGYDIYRTTYDITTWSGKLIKENQDSVTGISTVSWNASINSSHSVKIANSSGTALQSLSWSNLHNRQQYNNAGTRVDLQASLATDLSNSTTPSLDSDGNLSSTNSTLGQSRLNFILGASNANYRDRDSLLGDIINSNPVLVGGAQYLTYIAQNLEPDGNYASFATTQSERRKQVYVGANDGMLHGFDATTGAEQFAFVPSAVIPELYRLTDPDYSEAGGKHHYYVDGTPVVRDVYINNQWRTVLVGTLRAGGRSIFALDVTDPDNITLLWEFSQGDDLGEDATSTTPSDMGYSFATPTLAKLHSGEWAVVTGNGYDSDSGRAALLLIDIASGELLKKIPTAESDTDNGLSTVRVADNNNDGVADYVYAGDLKGNLWRFDLINTSAQKPLTSSASLDDYKLSFDGDPLYSAVNGDGTAQPITAPPSLVRHSSMEGYIVIFGTGRYFRDSDKLSAENAIMQSLYGIWDKQTIGQAANSTPTLSRNQLQKQSLSTSSVSGTTVRTLSANSINWHSSANSNGKYGWYFDLAVGDSAVGERIVDEMSARGQVLIATSRTPSDDPCSAGLEGWTYAIDPHSGGSTTFVVFDFNGDGKVDSDDSLDGTAISGIKNPAGGFTLSGDTLFNTEGSSIQVNYGPSSEGRQTWQLFPED